MTLLNKYLNNINNQKIKRTVMKFYLSMMCFLFLTNIKAQDLISLSENAKLQTIFNKSVDITYTLIDDIGSKYNIKYNANVFCIKNGCTEIVTDIYYCVEGKILYYAFKLESQDLILLYFVGDMLIKVDIINEHKAKQSQLTTI